MTVQTTTLPAADPIRLGSQPIRRRALVPRAVAIVEVSAGPDDDVPVDAPEQPETDAYEAVAAPETDAPEAVEAAPEAVEPPRRGRGRPRKDVVDVIAQGRTTGSVAYARPRSISAAVMPATPDSVQMIPDVVATEHDVIRLGQAVVQAAKCGLQLEAYISTVRGIVAAYDRLYGSE